MWIGTKTCIIARKQKSDRRYGTTTLKQYGCLKKDFPKKQQQKMNLFLIKNAVSMRIPHFFLNIGIKTPYDLVIKSIV